MISVESAYFGDGFVQAEDGIRGYKVTGVQTCALPISSAAKSADGLAGCFGLAGGRWATSPGARSGCLTVSSLSTGRSSRTCTWPFGQWIVILEMTVSAPSPKWIVAGSLATTPRSV